MKYKKLLSIGLLATGLYALSLCPVKAAEEVKPYSLEETVEVYKDYNGLMDKSIADSVVTLSEIKKLNEFIEKHLPYIPKEDTNNQYSIIKRTLEKKISELYPGLIPKEGSLNVSYPANETLNPIMVQFLKELAERENDLLLTLDKNLPNMIQKDNLLIKDLADFYEKISEKAIPVEMPKKPDFVEHNRLYEKFLKDVKTREEYVKKKFISVSIVTWATNDNEDSQPWGVTDSELEKMLNLYNNKVYYSNDHKDIYVKSVVEDFPVSTLLPGWLGVTLGLIGPFLIKGLLLSYFGRESDDGDMGEVLLNLFCGTFLLDGIHPLVFPVRLIGLPLVTEFFRNIKK